jgi:hypothetical protein
LKRWTLLRLTALFWADFIIFGACRIFLENYFYKIIPSDNLSQKDQNLIVSVIADAVRGENYAVPLVARSSGNNLEMEKDWELLSDLDKDEIRHKQIFRDL